MSNEQTAENGQRMEWQVASGSPTAHVIDVTDPEPRRGERGYRRSGVRALCGRYPQRNSEPPWFASPVGPDAEQAMRSFMVQQCVGCLDALPASTDSGVDR